MKFKLTKALGTALAGVEFFENKHGKEPAEILLEPSIVAGETSLDVGEIAVAKDNERRFDGILCQFVIHGEYEVDDVAPVSMMLALQSSVVFSTVDRIMRFQ